VPASSIPDPQAIEIVTRLNGETVQQGSTRDMIFGVAYLIAFFSQIMTLEPGDTIATGIPAGVGFTRKPQIFLKPGDIVEVEILQIGKLRNEVIRREFNR
jgi:2-keto-4-pentenoate hydratase/2-oxohepta-3-ene-1,7-dioic acid hydratase in catechol pathway